MTLKKVILRAVSDLSCVFFFMSCSGQASTPLAVMEDRKKVLVSIRSNAVKAYYSNLQKALLSGGLMRIDRGSSDTPFERHTSCPISKRWHSLMNTQTAMYFSVAIQIRSISQNGPSQFR